MKMLTRKKMVFVFGSNTAGIHGAGAAHTAIKEHGAIYGKGYGHNGNSFAIPTKDNDIQTLPLAVIEYFIHGFIAFAHCHPKMTFQVTAIGCGLAGYKHEQIAPLFLGSSKNVLFDTVWKPHLGDDYNYWGSFYE